MPVVTDIEQKRANGGAPDTERGNGQRKTVLHQQLERGGRTVGQLTGDQHELRVTRELGDAFFFGEPLPVVPEDVLAAPVERREFLQAGRTRPTEILETLR
ncbi:hypothetical protein [Cryptosporangium sp. NPDC048952]|uniref:hypothetical protein n=1 Tax=Cryptosporangium sp. NPDC048952 TaxID=3363961 RepID=UPI00372216D9